MSCTNNCGCGVRTMNYLPAQTPAEDCFFMQRVAELFSGEFTALAATLTIDTIIDPTTPAPTTPYTFISAQSRSELATVNSIVPIFPTSILPELHAFNVSVSVSVEVLFTDATGTLYRALGTVNLVLEVRTFHTHESLLDLGIPAAIVGFEAQSGTYLSSTTFSVILCGSADLAFLCPALLKMRYEGECSFMPPIGERMIVTTPEVLTTLR